MIMLYEPCLLTCGLNSEGGTCTAHGDSGLKLLVVLKNSAKGC
jgi:hypothetical protein